MEWVSIMARELYFALCCCICNVIFMAKCLGWKTNAGILIMVICLKAVIINGVFCGYLLPIYGTESWCRLCLIMISSIFMILIYAAYYRTFQGSLLKIGFIGVVSEMHVVVLFFCSLVVINYIEGRENLFVYTADFQLPDLFIIVMVYGVIKIELSVTKRWQAMLRRSEIKHRKLLWGIMGIYLINAVVSNFIFQGISISTTFLIPILIFSILLFGFIYQFRGYGAQVRAKRTFLQMQQMLMQNHYQMLTKQIAQMERNQEIVKQQMDRITKMDIKEMEEGKIKEYLLAIQRQYEEIQAGIFCDDCVVDAVLCHMKGIGSKYGIDCEYSFHKYQKGWIVSGELSELLFEMMDFVIKQKIKEMQGQKGTLRLTAGNVKNQILIELSCDWTYSKKMMKAKLLPYVSRYDGSMSWCRKKEKTYRLTVQLKGDKRCLQYQS